MKRNNKGFSLVELIVVIGIMAVLVGLSTVSISMLTGSYPRECAQKVSSQLNATKTTNMSRFDETMRLYRDNSDDCIYTANMSYTLQSDATSVPMDETDEEITQVGSRNVKVVAYLTDGSQVKISEDYASITISYNRATGAMDPVLVNGVDVGAVYVERIVFSQGSKAFAIEFIKETGKHKLTDWTI